MTTALTAVMSASTFGQLAAPAAQAQIRDFNIPAQSLTTALALFGQQSGVQVTADGSLVRTLASSGVSGRMTPAEALQRLIAGTGMTYSVASSGTFSLQKQVSQTSGNQLAVELPPVRVQGGIAPGGDPYADPEAPYKADRL